MDGCQWPLRCNIERMLTPIDMYICLCLHRYGYRVQNFVVQIEHKETIKCAQYKPSN